MTNRQFVQLFDIYKVQHGGGRHQQTQLSSFTCSSSDFSSGYGQSWKDIMTDLMNELQNESSKKRFYSDLDELNFYMRTSFPLLQSIDFE